MRKPVVDYRGLRPSNITSPQYRHLLLLLGWVVYFLLYFLTENLIPAENCYPVHSKLDDIIPFCEWFVIPYVGWYVLIVVSLLYFAAYNVENFKGLQEHGIPRNPHACYKFRIGSNAVYLPLRSQKAVLFPFEGRCFGETG